MTHIFLLDMGKVCLDDIKLLMMCGWLLGWWGR